MMKGCQTVLSVSKLNAHVIVDLFTMEDIVAESLSKFKHNPDKQTVDLKQIGHFPQLVERARI